MHGLNIVLLTKNKVRKYDKNVKCKCKCHEMLTSWWLDAPGLALHRPRQGSVRQRFGEDDAVPRPGGYRADVLIDVLVQVAVFLREVHVRLVRPRAV